MVLVDDLYAGSGEFIGFREHRLQAARSGALTNSIATRMRNGGLCIAMVSAMMLANDLQSPYAILRNHSQLPSKNLPVGESFFL